MKRVSLKIVLLLLYLASLLVVLKATELTTGFSGLVILGVLGYASIIVVAQSLDSLVELCRSLNKQLAAAKLTTKRI